MRPLAEIDPGAVLRLNNAHAAETSELDATGLARLVDRAFWAVAVGVAPDALMIALDETAAHDSPNWRWFADRHARFVYVDRVIVAAGARGQGLARMLYEGLFARARAADHTLVACEVNLDPPNPGSDAFHARLGFTESGRATLPGGKVVRYLTRPL